MKPTQIILHHSFTSDSKTVSFGAIRKYHVETLGWKEIGYHIGIELARNDYEIFMGRMWDIQGAHTKGQNHNSLGICFIGNYDLKSPSDKILETGAKVVSYWMRLFNISIDSIFGHRHFASYKSCPGNLFNIEKFKILLK